MAQYEISITPLIEMADTILSLHGDLSAVHERLERILSEVKLSDGFSDLRRQISSDLESVRDLREHSKKLGLALKDVTEVYLQAEQNVFHEGNIVKGYGVSSTAPAKQVVHRAHSALLSGELVMPGWLQAAVIKYQQSKPE